MSPLMAITALKVFAMAPTVLVLLDPSFSGFATPVRICEGSEIWIRATNIFVPSSMDCSSIRTRIVSSS